MGVDTLLKGSSSSKLASQLKGIVKSDAVDVAAKSESFGRALESARRIVDSKTSSKLPKSKKELAEKETSSQPKGKSLKGKEALSAKAESKADATQKKQVVEGSETRVTKADIEKAEGQSVAPKPTRAHIVAESVKATLERLAAQSGKVSDKNTAVTEKKVQKSTSASVKEGKNADLKSTLTSELPDSKAEATVKGKALASTAPVAEKLMSAAEAVKNGESVVAGDVDANSDRKDKGQAVSLKQEEPKQALTKDQVVLKDSKLSSVEASTKVETAKTNGTLSTKKQVATAANAGTTASVVVDRGATDSDPGLVGKNAPAEKTPKTKSDVSHGKVAGSHDRRPVQTEVLAQEEAVKVADLGETAKATKAGLAELAEAKLPKGSGPNDSKIEEEKTAEKPDTMDMADVPTRAEGEKHAAPDGVVASVNALPKEVARAADAAGAKTPGLSDKAEPLSTPVETDKPALASVGSDVETTKDPRALTDEKAAVTTVRIDKKAKTAKADMVADLKQAQRAVKASEQTPVSSDKASAHTGVTVEEELRASQHLARAVGRQSIAKAVTVSRDEAVSTKVPTTRADAADTAKSEQSTDKSAGKKQEPLRVEVPAKHLSDARGNERGKQEVVLQAKRNRQPEPQKTSGNLVDKPAAKTLDALKTVSKEARVETPVSREGSINVRVGDSKDQVTFERGVLVDTIASKRDAGSKPATYGNLAMRRTQLADEQPDTKIRMPLMSSRVKSKPANRVPMAKDTDKPVSPGKSAQASKPAESLMSTGKAAAIESAVASAKTPVAVRNDGSQSVVDVTAQDTGDGKDTEATAVKEISRQGTSQNEARRDNESRHQELKKQIETEMRSSEAAADELEEAMDTELADEVVQAKQFTNAVKTTARENSRGAVMAMRDAADTPRNQAAVSERRELHERILAKNLGRNLGRIASMGTTHARLQLHPQELGRVDVEIRTKDGEVTLLVRTETVQAAAELNSQMNDLRGSMREHGLDLTECDVDARGFGDDEAGANGSGEGREGDRSSGRGEDNREGRGNRRRRGRGQRIKRSAIDVVV